MTRDQFLDALQGVDGRWLAVTADLLGYEKPVRRHGGALRLLVAAAVAAALLLAAFTAAMATNEDFRARVYKVFHIETPEQIPAQTAPPEDAGKIVLQRHVDLGGAAEIDYYSVRTPIMMQPDGMLYDPDGRCLYRFGSGGVEEIPTTQMQIRPTFRGVEFAFTYDYAETEDGFLVGWCESPRMNENPYGFAVNLTVADPHSGKAWLELPDWEADYVLRPMLLDLKTGEVTDVMAGVDVSFPGRDSIDILWRYSPDMTHLIAEDTFDGRAWLFDLAAGTKTTVAALLGLSFTSGAEFEGADTLLGFEIDLEAGICRTVRYSLSTGERELIDLSEYAKSIVRVHGMYTLEVNMIHRYVTFPADDGTRQILNVRDGSVFESPDVEDPGANMYASPDGRRIAFVWYDTAEGENGLQSVIRKIAMLDVETGEYTILDRERRVVSEEHPAGWVDNDRFLLITEGDGEWVGMNVYALHAPE